MTTSPDFFSDDAANRLPDASQTAPLVVPVIEEYAVVHREVVENGRVRLSKTVREHEEAVDLALQHEEVRVERVPLNQFVADETSPPATRYEGDTLVIPVVREVMVKRLLLVEELRVTKHQIQTQETQHVTLRHEQIQVDRLAADGTVTSLPISQNPTLNLPQIFKIMSQTVVGIFDTAAEAQNAAQQLQAAGFSLEHVDVSTRNAQSGQSSGSSNQTNTSGTATEGVTDAASRTGDGIGNFFSNLFGGDDYEDTQRYSHVARSTGSVVTVHAHSAENAHRAAEILDAAGAVDVDERASQSGYQATGKAAYAGATETTGATSAKVIEESLQVGKRVEQTGGARLRSRIVERPVEASVRLREEHVTVERHPVNRPATEADFTTFKEGNIEITESAERAVVGKEARVIEEVSLGKEVTEREETIRDTVRKTEVDVERIEGTTGTKTSTSYDTDETKTKH